MRVVFISEPRLHPVGSKGDWALDSDFFVRIENDAGDDAPVNIKVPAGFATDLASVPRLPVVHWLFAGRARRAAILHDWLYELRYPRKWADRVFRAAMQAEGVGAINRWAMWAGVRIGGGYIYRSYQEQSDPFNYFNSPN